MAVERDPATLVLPETVMLCQHCGGRGEYKQRYCDVAAEITGPCEFCCEPGNQIGSGFRYAAGRMPPAPASVVEPILNTNGVDRRQRDKVPFGWIYQASRPPSVR